MNRSWACNLWRKEKKAIISIDSLNGKNYGDISKKFIDNIMDQLKAKILQENSKKILPAATMVTKYSINSIKEIHTKASRNLQKWSSTL